MRYVTAGDDVTIVAPFMAGLDYAAPDAGSVTYTLRDNAGAAIAGQTNVAVAVTAGANQWPITILAARNTVGGGMLLEKRTLEVSFTVGTQPYRYVANYRVTAHLPITVTEDDVRSVFGLSTTELPDEDIDLVVAYFDVDAALGAGILLAALTSGQRRAITADQAVTYRAAINLIASLPLRILQQESTGTNKYARFLTLDLDTLRRSVSALLDDAYTVLTGVVPPLPRLVVVGGRTDIITGI